MAFPGYYLKNIFALLFLLFCLNSFSQKPGNTVIKGSVTDSKTGEPVPFASVIMKGTTVGTRTDSNGKYIIETNNQAGVVEFSFIGYQSESRKITPGKEQTLNVHLNLSVIELDEVMVKPQRVNYRNKNNPAVELIEKVIEKKEFNRPESYQSLEYNKYEKIQFAISNIDEKTFKGNKLEKYRFAFENVDTTKRIGNKILPVLIMESLSDQYFKKDPVETKEIIKAQKITNLNEYFDNKGVSGYLNYLYQNINIYDNEILFLTNKFLSPIANTAPTFYRYYILDTLSVENINCVKLFFEPRNKEDFLFHGNLYIIMDSTFAVRKIDMGINKNINLDWIQEISITQDFEQILQKGWILSKEDISIDFGIVKNSLGLFGQRIVTYKDYKINQPLDEAIFKGPEKIERIDPLADSKGFWEANRHIPLSVTEKGTYNTIDSLRKMPEFKKKMKLLTLVTTGFYDLGKIEIGPAESFISFNSVEGLRLRFGGRTNTSFSKKLTFDAYGAYGLNDNIFKYNAGVSYSLTPRTIYQFPVKSMRISLLKDTRIPGQELLFTQPDNGLLSFKRGPDDKLFLNNTLRFEYLNEFENHFSFQTGYSYTNQSALGNIHFTRDDYLSNNNDVDHINISELFLNLRYAPNESFYQGKMYRYPFPGKYPVLELKTSLGSSRIGNDYDYLRLQFSISRRFYVSVIGYTDITAEAGKIFGRVPYPLLFIPPANQTYSYLKNSYSVMNFLEFVSDQYVSLNVDHSFNGFFLNKIPVISKLKFREVVTCKVIYGRINKNNNPLYNADLLKFPVDESGTPLTYSLENKPYVEAGIGLSNIFRVLRVDLVKRLNYLDHPNISTKALMIHIRLDI
jgi:hypothetical protein